MRSSSIVTAREEALYAHWPRKNFTKTFKVVSSGACIMGTSKGPPQMLGEFSLDGGVMNCFFVFFLLMYIFHSESGLHLKGFRTGTPKACHSGTWIILSWRQWRPNRLKKNFYLSLNHLKEFRQGALSRKRATTWNNFLCGWPICMAEHLLTKHLLFLSSWELLFSSLKSQAPSHSLAQDSI